MFRSAASPVADVFKFETVVPVAAKKVGNPEREVRLRCCDGLERRRRIGGALAEAAQGGGNAVVVDLDLEGDHASALYCIEAVVSNGNG